MRRRYIAWDILIVSLGNDGILAKDVVYELWRHDNVFTAFRSPQPQINWLTKFALFLRVGCGLREQETLGRGLGVKQRHIHDYLSTAHAIPDHPKIPSW